ncbi:MAG: hypothetical protein HYT80_08450 [Euryarchaeota archaeon]|nr:hypothetical protein [Euryarchaeota archaeon]
MMVAPSGAATNVLDWIVIEDDGGDGLVTIVCLAPGFVNCSVAAAFAAGGCALGQCLEVQFGAIGHLSSIALPGDGNGGHSLGAVNEKTLSCYWEGFSGACLAVATDFIFDCGTGVTAESNGALTFYIDTNVAAIVPAPQAVASAIGCGIESSGDPSTSWEMVLERLQSDFDAKAAALVERIGAFGLPTEEVAKAASATSAIIPGLAPPGPKEHDAAPLAALEIR